MPRTHDKEHFYKFMSCETAKIVLENSSLRWTKPSLFNDPFDHQISFKHPYTQNDFSSALATEIERLVYADEVNFIEETLLSKMVTLFREQRDQIPKNEIVYSITKGCEETAELFQDFQDNLNNSTTIELNQSRVLCVAENKVSKNVHHHSTILNI